MFTYSEALAKLDDAIPESGDVYINRGVDATSYLALLESDVRVHLCEPFEVSAQVMPPGFPFAEVGETLHAYCIAHHAGNWLAYQPHEDRFLCFWGEDVTNLGAHGVVGSPLYCWSA